jgi:hypothetical protein
VLFDLYSRYITKENLDRIGHFNIRGQVIISVKYADSLMLQGKEETVLQGTIVTLIEIGKCYGMAMNMEQIKVMRASRQQYRL